MKKEEEEEEEEERKKEVAKQQEEKYEAKMKLLNDRGSNDVGGMTSVDGPCPLLLVLWEEEEEEEEEASTSSLGADTSLWAMVPLSLFVVWCWHDAFHAVFPMVVGRPEMLGIMAGTYQKDSCALIVDSGSGMCKVGIAGYCGPRFMSPPVVARLKMLHIMADADQKNSYVVLPCHDAEAVSHGPDCSADP